MSGEKIDPDGAKALALLGGGLEEQLTHLNLKSLFRLYP